MLKNVPISLPWPVRYCNFDTLNDIGWLLIGEGRQYLFKQQTIDTL